MTTDRIFQRFDLDFEALESKLGVNIKRDLDKLSEAGKKTLVALKFPETTRILRERLVQEGYEFLESNDIYCGLHGSIIIGGEFGKNPKEDFYELAAVFDLPYRSGQSYFEAKLESLTQSEKTETDNSIGHDDDPTIL